jgi:hypothetical protein
LDPALAGNRTQAPAAAQPPPRALYAHFLAAPEAFPDGSPAAAELDRFRQTLVAMCGGYTELGPAAGAWLDPSGRVQAEGNRAFLVTCPDNRGAELSRAIRQRFRQQEAYVLVWGVESP